MEWPNLNETFKEWLISRNNNYSAATFVADGSHRRMGEMVASSLVLSHADTNATAPDTVTAEEMNRDPLSVLISITVIYSLLFLVGLVGNLITCIVISRNKSMHTATNFYLFNLAITDMLILLSAMPPELYNAWYPFQYPFDKTVCVLQGLLAETSTNVTILTISSFTIERYIAICHPFRQQAMSKLSRAIKFIVGIWIFAILAAVPQAVQFGVVEVDGHVLCTIANPSTSYAFEVSSLIFFVSPMILICMLYILIGLKLRQSHRVISKFSHRATRPRGNSTNSTAHHEMKSSLSSPSTTASGANVSYGQIAPKSTTAPKKSQRRIIKMLVAVVVAFFLCWAPFHAQRLCTVYGSSTDNNTPKSPTFYLVYVVLTHISGVTFFLSTCINPLLYSVMSYKFRSAFKTTIGSTCFKFNWKKRWSSRTNGGSSKMTTTSSSKPPEVLVAVSPIRREIDLRSMP